MYLYISSFIFFIQHVIFFQEHENIFCKHMFLPCRRQAGTDNRGAGSDGRTWQVSQEAIFPCRADKSHLHVPPLLWHAYWVWQSWIRTAAVFFDLLWHNFSSGSSQSVLTAGVSWLGQCKARNCLTRVSYTGKCNGLKCLCFSEASVGYHLKKLLIFSVVPGPLVFYHGIWWTGIRTPVGPHGHTRVHYRSGLLSAKDGICCRPTVNS